MIASGCTAPVRGHRGDSAECSHCPVHGQRLRPDARGARSDVAGALTRTVCDRDGNPVAVTPGLIDTSALSAYTEGQCLALAVELAQAIGSNNVLAVTTMHDRRSGVVSLNVHHVWALSVDGLRAYDISGVTPVSAIMLAQRTYGSQPEHRGEAHAHVMPASLAKRVIGEWMGDIEQDYATAATFVEALVATTAADAQEDRVVDGSIRASQDSVRPFEFYTEGSGWMRM